MASFVALRVVEVELSERLPTIASIIGAAPQYHAAMALVRLHGEPLGFVELALRDGANAPAIDRQIRDALADEIVGHLRMDGLDEFSASPLSTVPLSQTPRCIREREKLLPNAPFISVVISTRDRPDSLARSLASLCALDYPHYEIVVVDNAPATDATENVIRRDFAQMPQVRYIREDQPGLSRARNRGVEEARGVIVAFTDDDVVVDRQWLIGLARGFARAPHVGCVTGLVVPLELETQAQVWFEQFGGFGKGFHGKLFDEKANRPRSKMFPYAAGRFGSGNNMAFRVESLRRIGGFDPALGAGSPTRGGEDLAAFVAVLRKGYALAYEPSAVVHHQHRRDYAALRKHIYDCGLGLTAYLTKCLVDFPSSSLELAWKVPFGLWYALRETSPKNRKKRLDYPKELSRIEWQGMWRGPLAYLRARYSRSFGGRVEGAGLAPRRPIDEFSPMRVLEVEISKPLPSVPTCDPQTGRQSTGAEALVRLHSQPLGLVHLTLPPDGLDPAEYASCIWACFSKRIIEHLREDGQRDVAVLTAAGLPDIAKPLCQAAREAVVKEGPMVSVVVPTHDRPQHLAKCLASLAHLNYPRYEIIVVDNAPSSNVNSASAKALCRGVPGARYVREDRPGASWARNRGLLEARGEIVAFTDDDAIVDPNWLVELVKAFRSAKNVGCVTGNVLACRLDTAAQAWFEARGGFSRGFKRKVYDTSDNTDKHPLYPYSAMIFGSGNNMAFQSSVLRSIGGFDPALDPASPSRGGEDLAAFFEVIVRGYQLVYEPAAIVRHLHRSDYAGLHRQMQGWGTGFSAYLARTLHTHPQLLPDFLGKMPQVLAILLKGGIPYRRERMKSLGGFFPESSNKALWRTEAFGYAYGLVAYIRSLLHVRHITRRFGDLSVSESGDA